MSRTFFNGRDQGIGQHVSRIVPEGVPGFAGLEHMNQVIKVMYVRNNTLAKFVFLGTSHLCVDRKRWSIRMRC